MSHLSVSKISIKDPNPELLKGVVMQIMQDLGGKETNTVKDMVGTKAEGLIMAFTTKAFNKGVGIRISKGQVEIVGDFWGCLKEKQMLEAELKKLYTASAMALTLRKMGYQVETRKTMGKVMIIAEN